MARDSNSFTHTIESLRIDLLRLTYNFGAAKRDLAVEAMESVLLNRIAVLEAAIAILRSLTSAPTLIPALSVSALETLQEAAEDIPRQSFD